jgi:predicted KAP-like P-loop ATPase
MENIVSGSQSNRAPTIVMLKPTKSFESPVSLMNEDRLDRWRLAKDVFAIIQETPPDWSCRIGIYGKWGEGKTSLLRFVETQAQDAGLISFWINPSEAQDADDLWRSIINAFIDALESQDVVLEEVRAWRVRMLADKTKPLNRIAELNPKAKALVGFGREAIKEWLRPDGEQIRRIRTKLHSKTVLVFIDDLDRADPKLVPTLLLGLRDVLDLPGFCFVLAFDGQIISDALASVNKAWGDGSAFLDKILDFSLHFQSPHLINGRSCLRAIFRTYARGWTLTSSGATPTFCRRHPGRSKHWSET